MSIRSVLYRVTQDTNNGEWTVNQANFWDSGFRIVDDADTTKELAFSVSGITTATTRTITIPDYSFTLGSNAGGLKNVVASSGNETMTQAMSGSVMLIDSATTAYALPAISASNVGMSFYFIVTTTSTTATITAQAGDILTGGVSIMSTTAGAENDAFSANGSSDLVLTMNGTTKGGIIGSWVRYDAITATRWAVTGGLIGSGTIVTPFS